MPKTDLYGKPVPEVPPPGYTPFNLERAKAEGAYDAEGKHYPYEFSRVDDGELGHFFTGIRWSVNDEGESILSSGSVLVKLYCK